MAGPSNVPSMSTCCTLCVMMWLIVIWSFCGNTSMDVSPMIFVGWRVRRLSEALSVLQDLGRIDAKVQEVRRGEFGRRCGLFKS